MVKLPDATSLGVRLPGPARGQPSYPGGSPVANAIQGFGSTVANVGFDFARQSEQKALKEQDLGAQSRFLQFEDQWSKSSIDRAQQAAPGAAGFTEGLKKEYFKSAQEFLKTVPADMRPEYDTRLFELESRLTDGAGKFEREEADRYANGQIEDGQNVLLSRQAADPAKWQDVEKEGEKLIRSHPSKSPIEVEEQTRAWRKRRALQLFQTRQAQAEGADVEAERERLGVIRPSGKLSADVGERASSAVSYFMSRGYSKEQAAGIVGNLLAESKLNTGARNAGDGQDGSDSIGIGQWNGNRARALKAFAAENRADWRDYNIQLAFVDHELRTSESGARNALKSARNVDEATAAMAGYERPEGWSPGNPRGAHNYAGRLSFAQQAAGGQVTGTDDAGVDETLLSDPAPEYAALDFEDRLKLFEQSLADERKRNDDIIANSRARIETAVQNAPVAYQNTGAYSGNLPDRGEFIAAWGEREGEERYSAFQTAVSVGQTAHEFQTMPADEIQAAVRNATPLSSGDNAALETKAYEAISGAAEATMKARAADPGGYVMQAFPSVQRAWEGALAEGGYQAAIASSVAAQQQLGIQDIQPLPKKVAGDVVATFKDQNQPEDVRMSVVTDALLATADSGQRKAIFEQLVDAGLPETTEGAVVAMERGDTGAARRLFQAAIINPAELPGKVAATPAEIDQSIQDAIMAEGQIGDVYYGLDDGTADNFERASRDSKLLTNAVNLRMHAGETLEAAISGASKDLFGDVQVVNESNAQLLLPKEQDADAVLRGLRATMPAVRTMLEQSFAIPDQGGRTGAIVTAASTARTEDILANGYFRNADDGYVFIDPYTGGAVADADGQPVIFTTPTVVGDVPANAAAQTRRERVTQPNDKPLTDDDFNRFQQRMQQ